MGLRNNGIIRQGEYEGMTLDEAVVYAEQGGFTTRVTEKDGNSFMLTMDYRTDRINFRVRNDIIIDAYGG